MHKWNPWRRAAWIAGVACTTVAMASCDNSTTGPVTNNGNNNHATSVSVYVKDAPGNVDSVWVQIEDIVLVRDSGDVSLLDAPTGLINLTALQDTAAALVTADSVAPGDVQQVRFILGGAVLRTTQGAVYAMGGAEDPNGNPTTGTLQCPSCAQSGLKVVFPHDVVMEDSTENGILLDFDVSQSFGHQAGKSGKWVMHPVIHGHMSAPGEIENGNPGAMVTGMVSMAVDTLGDTLAIPPCGGAPRTLEEFVPVATATTLVDDQGDSLKFSGHTAASGMFKIDGLDFDSYALGYQAETAFDSTKLVWQATVDPASVVVDSTHTAVADVAYTITGVSCDTIAP